MSRKKAPDGWIKANGAILSRTTYADLFTAIGTTFGSGNASTTFQIPDLRGDFIRGFDDGRGVDGGRALGSLQTDELKAHKHIQGAEIQGNIAIFGVVRRSDTSAGYLDHKYGNADQYPYTSTEGGSETRPRNTALLACIKY